MNRLTYIFVLLCSYGYISCNTTANNASTEDSLNPIALNDKAMQIITTAKDSNGVFKGLFYLDQAIELDKEFIPAYLNKINTLLRIQKTNKALKTIQELNAIKTIPENIMFEGFIYDREMNDSLQAHQKYLQALTLYDTEFVTTQDSTLLLNKGLAILFSKGKDAGIQYYQKLENVFSNNPLYENLKLQAENFDKQQFLRNLW
jgi:tetratricopeptide (TPR) repeat protein